MIVIALWPIEIRSLYIKCYINLTVYFALLYSAFCLQLKTRAIDPAHRIRQLWDRSGLTKLAARVRVFVVGREVFRW